MNGDDLPSCSAPWSGCNRPRTRPRGRPGRWPRPRRPTRRCRRRWSERASATRRRWPPSRLPEPAAVRSRRSSPRPRWRGSTACCRAPAVAAAGRKGKGRPREAARIHARERLRMHPIRVPAADLEQLGAEKDRARLSGQGKGRPSRGCPRSSPRPPWRPAEAVDQRPNPSARAQSACGSPGPLRRQHACDRVLRRGPPRRLHDAFPSWWRRRMQPVGSGEQHRRVAVFEPE